MSNRPMFANHYGYSDVHPFEIVRYVSDKTIEIRAMNATLDPAFKPEFHVGGFAAHCSNQHEQKWVYSSDHDAKIRRIRLSKIGIWKDKYGNRYSLANEPKKFYDYNY